MLYFIWLYFICRTMWLGYTRMGTITNLQIFEYPQKFLLKSSHLRKHLPNFPTRKFLELKVSNPKNPLMISITWNPEYPPGVHINTLPNSPSLTHQFIPVVLMPPPPSPVPCTLAFFVLDWKFFWAWILQLPNACPVLGMKKESKCIVRNQHCSCFHSSHSVE